MSIFKSDLLAGQVALVTGGGSGICKVITRTLMEHGADTVIASRDENKLSGAAAELSSATGRRCLATAADVRDEDAIYRAAHLAVAELGRLDILVNGAAGNFLASAAKLSSKGFKTVLEIDTLGTFNACKAAFQTWMEANGGCILNISATLHYTGVPMQSHAGAAKAAIDALTRHLAFEWGGLGIRVNGIAPGPIADTEGMKRLLPPEMKADLERRIPLRRFGTAQEIADACLYLASSAAGYVTGTTLVVDGGAWMLGPPFGDLG